MNERVSVLRDGSQAFAQGGLQKIYLLRVRIHFKTWDFFYVFLCFMLRASPAIDLSRRLSVARSALP